MHEWAHAELARLREAYPHRFGWAVYQHLFEVARQTRRAADAISMQGMSETERHSAHLNGKGDETLTESQTLLCR